MYTIIVKSYRYTCEDPFAAEVLFDVLTKQFLRVEMWRDEEMVELYYNA